MEDVIVISSSDDDDGGSLCFTPSKQSAAILSRYVFDNVG